MHFNERGRLSYECMDRIKHHDKSNANACIAVSIIDYKHNLSPSHAVIAPQLQVGFPWDAVLFTPGCPLGAFWPHFVQLK